MTNSTGQAADTGRLPRLRFSFVQNQSEASLTTLDLATSAAFADSLVTFLEKLATEGETILNCSADLCLVAGSGHERRSAVRPLEARGKGFGEDRRASQYQQRAFPEELIRYGHRGDHGQTVTVEPFNPPG